MAAAARCRRRDRPAAPWVGPGKDKTMETIKAFLVSKGVTEDQLKAWPDDQCKAVAKAMGFQPSAVRLEVYSPQKGSKGEGLYLIASVKGGRDSYFRLNDGKALTDEGRAVAKGLAEAILATIE